MESAKTAKNKKENRSCYDCGRKIIIEGKEIRNGKLLFYEDSGGKIRILKCQECFSKNPGLSNFRKCEVYSRIVGYIRPVSQWNLGKKQEFGERKVFAAEN